MIQIIMPLAVGNAVQMRLAPPKGAVAWRVLRRTALPFAGPVDPGAFTVAEASNEATITDILNLENGRLYHYAVFYQDRTGAWLGQVAQASATPTASYRGDELDVQTLVRDRLDLGMKNEVLRQRIKSSAPNGKIEVTLAPFGMADKIAFPTVSVHLEHEASAERGIGEKMGPDVRNADGNWTESEGWLSRVTLQVVGVTDNPLTRIALRRALRRVIQANFPVFEAHGLMLIDFQQKDLEDTNFNAPLYFTVGTFSCIAPAFVADDVSDIEDVDVTLFST